MKRFFTIFLTSLLVLSLAACAARTTITARLWT